MAFLTIILVSRISCSIRGSTPTRAPGGAKATPLGATISLLHWQHTEKYQQSHNVPERALPQLHVDAAMKHFIIR
jgi:hypothetical protein